MAGVVRTQAGRTRTVLELDLDDIDVPFELDGEIDLTVIGDVLGDDLGVQTGEEGIEHAGVIALALGQIIVGEVTPGNAGKQPPVRLDQSVDIALDETLIERILTRVAPTGERAEIGVDQVIGQRHLHFLIGQTQTIEQPRASPARAVDGQIAGLEQQRHRVDALDVERIEDLFAGLDRFQARQKGSPRAQQVDEKARIAGLEPVGSEPLPFADEEQDIERVIDRLAQKAVAVVPLLEPRPVDPVQVFAEGDFKIGLGIAADRGEACR